MSSASQNQQGVSTILMGLMLLGGAGLVGTAVMLRGGSSTKLAAQEMAKIEVAAEANKVLSIAGFLVANNLVTCKEGSWASGGKANCRYDGAQRQDADLRAEVFGLVNQRNVGNNLVFDVVPRAITEPNSPNQVKNAQLQFELVNADTSPTLKKLIGSQKDITKSIDRDNYVVIATATIEYKKEGRTFDAQSAVALKRPIALTRLSLRTAAACAGQCNSSLSQNPFPSCRGPQSVNSEAVVEVLGVTTNLGPGALYDLAYKRSVCTKGDLNAVIGANGENCTEQQLTASQQSVTVPVSDLLRPDKSVQWADTAPCQMFVQTTRARTAGNAVQHVTEAGRISYQLDATSTKARIEPFRLNEPIDKSTGKLPGRLNVIYVVPPH